MTPFFFLEQLSSQSEGLDLSKNVQKLCKSKHLTAFTAMNKLEHSSQIVQFISYKINKYILCNCCIKNFGKSLFGTYVGNFFLYPLQQMHCSNNYKHHASGQYSKNICTISINTCNSLVSTHIYLYYTLVGISRS